MRAKTKIIRKFFCPVDELPDLFTSSDRDAFHCLAVSVKEEEPMTLSEYYISSVSPCSLWSTLHPLTKARWHPPETPQKRVYSISLFIIGACAPLDPRRVLVKRRASVKRCWRYVGRMSARVQGLTLVHNVKRLFTRF